MESRNLVIKVTQKNLELTGFGILDYLESQSRNTETYEICELVECWILELMESERSR